MAGKSRIQETLELGVLMSKANETVHFNYSILLFL